MRTPGSAVQRHAGLLLVALLGALHPLAALAHTFEAPASVQAESDGSFSYQWVFTVGPGTAFISSYGWIGIDNVGGGLIADCFCIPQQCTLEAGHVITRDVTGTLVDVTAAGVVENWVGLCDEPDFRVFTTILPPTTAVEDGLVPEPRTPRLTSDPNPCTRAATFSYSLEQPGAVELRLYDVRGRWVATAVDATQEAGWHSATWDLRGHDGERLVPGIYFARLEAGSAVRVRKLVVLD